MATKHKPAQIPIDEVPLILSRWRHHRTGFLLSDREMYGALLACWEAYCDLKNPEERGKWQREVTK